MYGRIKMAFIVKGGMEGETKKLKLEVSEGRMIVMGSSNEKKEIL